MNPTDPSEPTPAAGAPALRASDADRDRVADRLREALAEGRITPDEHAERIDVVYQARTYAELEPVLRDLPADPSREGSEPAPAPAAPPEETAPPPEPQSASIVAIFAGADRRGRWLVEPTTTVTCVFGGADLDFRRAVLSQREVTVNVSCVFGGVDITIPPGVRVISSISAVFGGVDLPEDDTVEPDAPVIRLTGMVLFGGVTAKRREAGATWADRRRERRESQRALHEERIRETHDLRHERLRQLRESRRRS
ncbi:DUF1707 domain-containing protein [Actinomadura viridis]|uniref:Cell wall-active antibiotic response 4TMS protein YvqF n=1 Tax=Actinomadura viridis TaxID=58110 RepID=A0A931DIY3_9ACTN|nr:DUF1707 domain-containing protein [Actinomadura viridis]MBG6088426.1 hypothetical protein [Actinomadura viridis]